MLKTKRPQRARLSSSTTNKQNNVFECSGLPPDFKTYELAPQIVRLVGRMFYSEVHIIVLEALLQHEK